MDELLKALKPFNYVVQRNWETLPELDKEHPDLDLLVSEEQYNDCLLVTQQYLWIDLRHPGDGYYPKKLAEKMLKNKRDYKGWKIPSKSSHFLSLYYHNVVHKNNNPYGEELKKIFLELIPPTKPEDQGVNYYV